MSRLELVAIVVTCVAVVSGCSHECQVDVDCPAMQVCASGSCSARDAQPSDGDADSDSDADSRSDADGETDASDADLDQPTDAGDGGGEGEVLMTTTSTLVGDLLCDVDGDGTPDNAFASFPAPLTSLAAQILDSSLHAWNRVVGIDLTRIDDAATPQSGPFEIYFEMLHDCDNDDSDNNAPGEVLGFMDANVRDASFPATVIDGELRGAGDLLSLGYHDSIFELRSFSLTATLSPRLLTLTDGVLCGYLTFETLDVIEYDPDPTYSVLEIITDPGRWLGGLSIPGLRPDIDADGDGLETFVVDEDGHISGCRDGDGLPVLPPPGSDSCIDNPDMADGYSATMLLSAVQATFLGSECPAEK